MSDLIRLVMTWQKAKRDFDAAASDTEGAAGSPMESVTERLDDADAALLAWSPTPAEGCHFEGITGRHCDWCHPEPTPPAAEEGDRT